MPTQLQIRAILRTLKKRKNIRSDQRCGTSNSDGEVSDSDSGTDSEESYDSDEYDTLDYEN